MADRGTVSFTYQTTDQLKAVTLTVTADGIELDDALDLIAEGAEARGWTVSRTQVVETVTRPGRERKPKPVDAVPVVVAAGEPAQVKRVRIGG
jgi:hypothetical protein